MQTSGTVTCSRCGTAAAAGGKFCKKCGAAINSKPTAPKPIARAPGVAAKASAAPKRRPTNAAKSAKKGLSIWWVIGPTLLFAYLSRQPVPIAIAAAIGAGLWMLKNYTVPSNADKNIRALEPFFPFAPAFQIAVVFIMLGGNLVVVGLLIAGVITAIRFRERILRALEPWWQVQASIPPALRKPLAIVVAGFVGYYFGKRAGGQEWTYTLISVTFGAVVAFLILFTPPDSVRAKRS